MTEQTVEEIVIVHWPGKSTPACPEHLRQLELAQFARQIVRECAAECKLLHSFHDGTGRVSMCGPMLLDKFGLKE